MVLIGNVGTGGSLTVERQGKLQQQNAVAQTLSSTLTVKGLMTHASNTSAQAFTIDFAAQTISHLHAHFIVGGPPQPGGEKIKVSIGHKV
jgi:hypothetical protein